MAFDKDKIVAALAGKVGRGVAEAAVEYLPALQRLGMAELTALAALLAEGDYDAAKAALHAKMTPDELATEKEHLAGLAELMAHDNAEARKFGLAIVGGVLKAAFGVLLSAAAF